MLHLVRHAPSRPEPSRPAHEWGLRDGAATAVAPLIGSGVLLGAVEWWSSAEPKAWATAALLTDAAVRVDPRLNEQTRTMVWFDDADVFRAVVRRSFADPTVSAVEGWEPLADTSARVMSALAEIVAAAGEGDVVAVGHGTAWTAAVAALTGSAPDLDAWEALTMPDHFSLDVDAAQVVSPWGGWRR
jgi:broad specificity phosphatase PhoE